MRVPKVIGIISVFLFLITATSFASDADVQETLRQMQERIDALEMKSSEQEKLLRMGEKTDSEASTSTQLLPGLELGVGGTMIVQGVNNVNYNGDGETLKDARADGSYSADITLGKEFEEFNSRAFVHLEAGQGAGLDDNLVLYSNVNRDAGDSEAKVEVTEFWYEQGMADEKALVTFGKLDPTAYFDNNEVANDETSQFLGSIFRNSPALEFPDNAAGIRMAYLPAEWLELGYGIFDGNSDWEKVGDNLFNIGQVHFKTKVLELPGNYRIYAWNSNVNHTKWMDTAKEKEAAYGFGLSFDQELSDITTTFFRYGWQNPKVYNPDIMATGDNNFSLEQSWSAGLQFEGKPWGRDNDVLAFAVGQVFPSDDYKKAGSSTVSTPNAKTEGHLEAYYRLAVNEHLSISPDVQYVWNPFGKDVTDDTKPVFIGGMRAQVDF